MDEINVSKILENFHSFSVDPNSTAEVDSNHIKTLLYLDESLKAFKPTGNMNDKSILIKYLNILTDTLLSSNINSSPISPEQLKFLEVATGLVDRISSHLILASDVNFFERMMNKFNEATTFIKNNKKLFEELTVESIDEVKFSEFEKSSRVEGINVTYETLQGIDETVKNFRRSLRTEKMLALKDAVVIYLVGPPGTGKSTLAMAAVTEFSNGVYYRFDIANLSNKYIGVAEAALVKIFEEYSQPGKDKITFVFDEIDEVLNSNASHLRSISSTIQTQLSGGLSIPKNILVIGITNHYSKLSDAMKRRQTVRIFVDIPHPMAVLYFLLDLIFPQDLRDLLKISSWFGNFLQSRFYTDRYTNANIRAIYNNIITFVNTKEGLERQRLNRACFTKSDLFHLIDDSDSGKIESYTLSLDQYISERDKVLPSKSDILVVFKSVKPMTEENYIDNLVESDEITEEIGVFRKMLWKDHSIKRIDNKCIKVLNRRPFKDMEGFTSFEQVILKEIPIDLENEEYRDVDIDTLVRDFLGDAEMADVSQQYNSSNAHINKFAIPLEPTGNGSPNVHIISNDLIKFGDSVGVQFSSFNQDLTGNPSPQNTIQGLPAIQMASTSIIPPSDNQLDVVQQGVSMVNPSNFPMVQPGQNSLPNKKSTRSIEVSSI